MTRPEKGLLGLLLATAVSSCAFTLDFDELQAGGEPSSGGSARGGSGTAGEGASDDGGTPGAAGSAEQPGIALEDAAAALAETLCGKLDACLGAAALEVFLADEDCETTARSSLANTIVANIQLSQDNEVLVYDGSAMPGCLDAYEALPCEEVSIAFPEECKQALGGLLAEGEDCAHNLECDAGLYCSTDTCPGTCSAPLQEGDPCTDTDVCAPGLTCFQTMCAPLGRQGDECGAELLPGCVTGFVCLGDNAGEMMPGKCFSATDVFVLSEGQACTVFGTPALCDVGAYCPLAIGAQCVAQAESGGACQATIPDMCPTGEFCDAGTCVALPGPNEACRLFEPRCAAYLGCVNNVCRPLGDIGDPCGVAAECHSSLCIGGECVPPACQ